MLSTLELLALSKQQFTDRRLSDAKATALQALEQFGKDDEPALLGKVRFHLGMIHRELGEVDEALAQFDTFLAELPSKYPDMAHGIGKAHFYRALTFRQQGDLLMAVTTYQAAMEHLHGWDRGAALRNLAWVYCLLNRGAEARQALLDSRAFSTADDLIQDALGDAFLAVVEGYAAYGSKIAELIVERAEKATAEERAQASWVAAKAAIAQGQLDKALRWADLAEIHATAAGDMRLVLDAKALAEDIEALRKAG